AEVIAQLRLPEEILMMARVGASMSEPDHIDVGLGRSRVLSQVDSLLRMTGREHLDVLILDVFDADVDRAETASAIETLLTLGKIRYVGVSHHTGWQLAEMRGAGLPIACAVAEYSLLNREAEDELIPAADYAGAVTIGVARLGRCVLADKFRPATALHPRLRGQLCESVGAYLADRSGRVLAGVLKAATALGVSMTDIALAFNRLRGIADSLVFART